MRGTDIRRSRRRPCARPVWPWRALAAAAALLVGGQAHAEKSTVEVGVASQLSWSSNVDFGRSAGQDDTVLEVRPRIVMRREGAGLSLTGSAGLNAAAYARHSQDNRIRPEADIAARAVAVERLFFVEAGYRASQGSADAFGARPDSVGIANTLTNTQARLSPIIEASAGDNLRYGLRSDNTWTRQIGADPGVPNTDGYFARHSAFLQREARPLGWRLSAERARTRFADDTQADVEVDQARASVSYMFDVDWVAGLRAGYERNNVVDDRRGHSFAGAELRWQPSARTTLSASAEDRFFGTGWALTFDHRSPFVAWNLSSTRDVSSGPQSLVELPAGSNVAALLDAMFTSRITNPVDRATEVRRFMDEKNLPSSTLVPISLAGQRFSVVTRHQATIGFIGKRNTLTLSAYQLLTRDVPDATSLATGSAQTNNQQRGAGANLSHQLGTFTTLNASYDWSRVRGLDTLDSQASTQRDLRLQLSVQASPKTNAFAGGRYRKLVSNVAQPGREGQVFVGVDHRF